MDVPSKGKKTYMNIHQPDSYTRLQVINYKFCKSSIFKKENFQLHLLLTLQHNKKTDIIIQVADI